jgi:hypothetical protein
MYLRFGLKIAENLAPQVRVDLLKHGALLGRLKFDHHFSNARWLKLGEELTQGIGLAVPDDFAQVWNQQGIPHL